MQRKWRTLLLVSIATFMLLLDATIVSVAPVPIVAERRVANVLAERPEPVDLPDLLGRTAPPTICLQGVPDCSPLEAGPRFLPLTLLGFLVAPISSALSHGSTSPASRSRSSDFVRSTPSG